MRQSHQSESYESSRPQGCAPEIPVILIQLYQYHFHLATNPSLAGEIGNWYYQYQFWNWEIGNGYYQYQYKKWITPNDTYNTHSL